MGCQKKHRAAISAGGRLHDCRPRALNTSWKADIKASIAATFAQLWHQATTLWVDQQRGHGREKVKVCLPFFSAIPAERKHPDLAILEGENNGRGGIPPTTECNLNAKKTCNNQSACNLSDFPVIIGLTENIPCRTRSGMVQGRVTFRCSSVQVLVANSVTPPLRCSFFDRF